MDNHEFTALLTSICQYFGKKISNSEQIVRWFAACKHVPSEAAEWIEGELCRECSRMPENLPQAIGTYFERWKAAYPHKVRRGTEHEVFGCSYCQAGLLWLQRGDGSTCVAGCSCHPSPGALGRVDPRCLPPGWRLRILPERPVTAPSECKTVPQVIAEVGAANTTTAIFPGEPVRNGAAVRPLKIAS